MTEKVIGYLYITGGTVLIILALVSVYMVFNNKWTPPDIFNLPGISLDLSNLAGGDLPPEKAESLKESGKLRTDLIESDIINKPLNLIFYLLFMGFIANIGFKIASLGVQMVRPIKVNLKGGDPHAV